MDPDFSPVESRLDHDFSFAFNDSNFSDRVLKIEIVADLPDVKSAGDGCSSITELTRNRKRRREDVKKDKGPYFSIIFLMNLDGWELLGLI